MRHAASRQLHAHWDAIRGGRLAPGRDEIDPAAIRGVLASVFVLDVAAHPLPRSADARFRVSGTRLDALFGRALRGSTFDRIWSPRASAVASAALGSVLDGRRPVTAAARGGPTGRDPVDIELLLLPLDAGAVLGGRVLGALSAAFIPDWMGSAVVPSLDLLSVRAPRDHDRMPGFGRRVGQPFTVHPGGRGGTMSTTLQP